MAVLLNLDGGEDPDEAEELYHLADLVNVACGGHAGDETTMARVIGHCVAAGTSIGAHPSYPDRASFGRVSLGLDPRTIRSLVGTQVGALRRVADTVPIHHVKPHGALYFDADADRACAEAVLDGVFDALGGVVAVIGPRGGALSAAAAARGWPYLVEGFADRGVDADGRLIPRGQPGALITDPARAASRVRELRVDTVCVHADTPAALAIVRAVRAVLTP